MEQRVFTGSFKRRKRGGFGFYRSSWQRLRSEAAGFTSLG
jgi:hypothetical protein